MDHAQVLFRLLGRHCPEGTVLFTEGSPGEEMFVVQSGAVRLVPAQRAEEEGVTCGPGEILGEEAFFGRVARTCGAKAVEDSCLLRVCDRTLETVVRHGPEVARTVCERLLERAGVTARRLDAWMLSRQALRCGPNQTAAPQASPRGRGRED